MKAKNKFNVGDHVSVISDTLKGVVVKIENQLIILENRVDYVAFCNWFRFRDSITGIVPIQVYQMIL